MGENITSGHLLGPTRQFLGSTIQDNLMVFSLTAKEMQLSNCIKLSNTDLEISN